MLTAENTSSKLVLTSQKLRSVLYIQILLWNISRDIHSCVYSGESHQPSCYMHGTSILPWSTHRTGWWQQHILCLVNFFVGGFQTYFLHRLFLQCSHWISCKNSCCPLVWWSQWNDTNEWLFLETISTLFCRRLCCFNILARRNQIGFLFVVKGFLCKINMVSQSKHRNENTMQKGRVQILTPK